MQCRVLTTLGWEKNPLKIKCKTKSPLRMSTLLVQGLNMLRCCQAWHSCLVANIGSTNGSNHSYGSFVPRIDDSHIAAGFTSLSSLYNIFKDFYMRKLQ